LLWGGAAQTKKPPSYIPVLKYNASPWRKLKWVADLGSTRDHRVLAAGRGSARQQAACAVVSSREGRASQGDTSREGHASRGDTLRSHSPEVHGTAATSLLSVMEGGEIRSSQLFTHPVWFHGHLHREDAETRLREWMAEHRKAGDKGDVLIKGAFLVRAKVSNSRL